MDNYITQWPLNTHQIDSGIEEMIQAEDNARHPVGRYQSMIQGIVDSTLGPYLRTDADNLTARTIIQSHLFFYGGLIITLLDRQFLSDTSTFIDQDLIRYAVYSLMGYGASNINYALHQHAHCKLTENNTINDNLDVSMSIMAGMPKWIWDVQHVIGHHGHGKSPTFGEVDTQKPFLARQRKGEYLKIFVKHDAPNAMKVNFETLLFMFKNWDTPEFIIGTPQKKKQKAITEVQEVGFDIGEKGEKIIMDEEIVVDYRNHALKTLCTYGIMTGVTLINPFYAVYYGATLILTKCTDYINHVKPDGSQRVFGMVNLSKLLAKKIVGFGSHTIHHKFGGLHPQYYSRMLQKDWEKGMIPEDNFEICDVQPGAGNKAIITGILISLRVNIQDFFSKKE